MHKYQETPYLAHCFQPPPKTSPEAIALLELSRLKMA